MTAPRRADAGAAVAGLFAQTSATAGLARREQIPPRAQEIAVGPSLSRVRQGVELTEEETSYLRSLSRPARTGQPRTLGSKFVATGVLAAAIELLRQVDVDMYGVGTGEMSEMTARARAALIRAANQQADQEVPE